MKPEVDRITSAEMKMLEKMFTREIDSAMAKSKIPPIFQSKAKIMQKMVSKGLIDSWDYPLGGGRFPVMIRGYMLTHYGRMIYCANC